PEIMKPVESGPAEIHRSEGKAAAGSEQPQRVKNRPDDQGQRDGGPIPGQAVLRIAGGEGAAPGGVVLVVPGGVRQIETVVGVLLAPAGAFVGAAIGTGAGVARDVGAAVGALGRWRGWGAPGHGSGLGGCGGRGRGD